MGAQRHQRGKPQYAGPYLRFSGRAGRRSARLSLLPFCQTASAFRLICLFHTFCRRGVYRAMVFAPLRCPKLFCFPFACLWAALSNCFAHLSFSNRVLDFYYANAEGGNFLTRIFKFFSFFYFRQRNTLGYVQNVVSVKSCANGKQYVFIRVNPRNSAI